MLGTFGGALEARHIDASNGKLVGEVTGEVETEEGVLVIRRIHVAMHLVASEKTRGTVERVHGIYAMRCPLYRTLPYCESILFLVHSGLSVITSTAHQSPEKTGILSTGNRAVFHMTISGLTRTWPTLLLLLHNLHLLFVHPTTMNLEL